MLQLDCTKMALGGGQGVRALYKDLRPFGMAEAFQEQTNQREHAGRK